MVIAAEQLMEQAISDEAADDGGDDDSDDEAEDRAQSDDDAKEALDGGGDVAPERPAADTEEPGAAPL